MAGLYFKGTDYLPLLIERARENRLQFFASFRMNDSHHKSAPRGVLAPKFWQEHQEYRLWEITDSRSYYNAPLDYSYSAVRKRKLDMIFEVATEYDVDGIELDMCRNCYFFQPSQAWRKRVILTEFVKTVGLGLNDISRKKGKKLKFIVRIPFGEARLKNGGIDVRTWIRRRYTDILVMSALKNDYNQSLGPYPGLCRASGILFYASTENVPLINAGEYPSMVKTRHNLAVPQTIDEKVKRQRAMAKNFLEQGADGIYMFNYPCDLFERKAIIFNDRRTFDKLASVLSEIGELKTLAGTDKEYCFFNDLPIYAESNRPRKFHQTIPFTIFGRDTNKAKKVIISFRQVALRNPHAPGTFSQNPMVGRGYVHYYVNGERIPPRRVKTKKQPAGLIQSGFELGPHQLVEIDIEPRKVKNGENSLAFEIPRFPEARDPYVYFYELKVNVSFDAKRAGRI